MICCANDVNVRVCYVTLSVTFEPKPVCLWKRSFYDVYWTKIRFGLL